MFLTILSHPIFINLNFHMPLIVDLNHPLILLTGENGSGKSTLLHSISYALQDKQVDGFVYRWEQKIEPAQVFLFDAEQHNPRMHLELFENNPQMKEFVQIASHGQVMLSMFRQTFPSLSNGATLLLDEPEMALSVSNQQRIVKMMRELVDQKNMRIICATHSPVLIESPETYVINLDNYINRNVLPEDMGTEGSSTIQ